MEFLEACRTHAATKFLIPKLYVAQEQVLTLISNNRYVCATMPTGSGKTLLYALPALIFEQGPTLVISPLIALMRDQMKRMDKARIKTVVLTSDQDEEERQLMRNRLREADTKLIFVSPERFALPSFIQLLKKIKPQMVVIDEAHCIVSWGHQFRPEYSDLKKYLIELDPPKICAFTATASQPMRVEIIRNVFPEHEQVKVFTSKPISQNIFVKSIRVFSMDEQWEELLKLISSSSSRKTIVYFSTRKLCEDFEKKFIKQKINAMAYHAGLSKQQRLLAEDYIRNIDKKIVVCATTAFGLGVDVEQVDLVVSYGFPSGIEEFFQMIGRAGRSGAPACGVLLWTGSDPVKRNIYFKKMFPLPAVFLDICQALESLLPKAQHQSNFVLLKDLELALPKTRLKSEKPSVEGIVSALRSCNCLEDPVFNQSYIQIKLSKNRTLDEISKSLPENVTKRKIVLEGLKVLIHKDLYFQPGAQFVLSEEKLIESCNLAGNCVLDVFSHFATQKDLSFDRISSIEAKQGSILKHGLKTIRLNLDLYMTVRKNFNSSLQQLEQLAIARSCRLNHSFDYFSDRTVTGARALNNYCYQCDLCAEKGRTAIHEKI